jgi:hypothetical protein
VIAKVIYPLPEWQMCGGVLGSLRSLSPRRKWRAGSRAWYVSKLLPLLPLSYSSGTLPAPLPLWAYWPGPWSWSLPGWEWSGLRSDSRSSPPRTVPKPPGGSITVVGLTLTASALRLTLCVRVCVLWSTYNKIYHFKVGNSMTFACLEDCVTLSAI